MKQVKIADLKNQLSRHLRAVEHGAEIEVTDRRRPIVRLVPAHAGESRIRIIPVRRSCIEVRNQRFPKSRGTPAPSSFCSRNGGSGECVHRLRRAPPH